MSQLKVAVVSIVVAILSVKFGIMFFANTEENFHSAINSSKLIDSNGPWLIIDRNVSVVSEPVKDTVGPLDVFLIILSAPKNGEQRQLTRQVLQAARMANVAKRELKWAFIIGRAQTPDLQVS